MMSVGFSTFSDISNLNWSVRTINYNYNGTEATHQHHTNTKQLTSPYNHNAHNSCAKAKGKNGCFIAPSMNSLLCLDHAGVVAMFSTGAKSPAPTTVVQRVRALLPSNDRGCLHVSVLFVPFPSSQCKLAVNVDYILLLLWRSNTTTLHCEFVRSYFQFVPCCRNSAAFLVRRPRPPPYQCYVCSLFELLQRCKFVDGGDLDFWRRSNITTPHCLSVHILQILFLVAATAPRFLSDGLGRLHISVLFAPLLSYCNNVSLLTAVIKVFGGDQILQHRTVCSFIS